MSTDYTPPYVPLRERGALTKVVGVRVTEDEYAVMTEKARQLNITVPQLLRLSWFMARRAEENAHAQAH